MTNVTAITKQAPPLPATTADLLASRKSNKSRTIIDYVEDIHIALYENPEYRKYHEAVFNAEAVEGDIKIDDIEACRLIKQHAIENAIPQVARANLAAIRKGLRYALARYGQTRKERREKAMPISKAQ